MFVARRLTAARGTAIVRRVTCTVQRFSATAAVPATPAPVDVAGGALIGKNGLRECVFPLVEVRITPPPPTVSADGKVKIGAWRLQFKPPQNVREAANATFSRGFEFYKQCATAAQLPTAASASAGVPAAEVALAGRSNVGKSSLLNTLCGAKRGGLARVSNTPGRTQLITYFTGHELSLVDLPGYGYAAAASRARADEWNEVTSEYIKSHTANGRLRLLLLLIDSRRGIAEIDRSFIEFLNAERVTYQIVLTKVDLLRVRELNEQIAAIRQTILTLPRTDDAGARAGSSSALLRPSQSVVPWIHAVSSARHIGLDPLRHSIMTAVMHGETTEKVAVTDTTAASAAPAVAPAATKSANRFVSRAPVSVRATASDEGSDGGAIDSHDDRTIYKPELNRARIAKLTATSKHGIKPPPPSPSAPSAAPNAGRRVRSSMQAKRTKRKASAELTAESPVAASRGGAGGGSGSDCSSREHQRKVVSILFSLLSPQFPTELVSLIASYDRDAGRLYSIDTSGVVTRWWIDEPAAIAAVASGRSLASDTDADAVFSVSRRQLHRSRSHDVDAHDDSSGVFQSSRGNALLVSEHAIVLIGGTPHRAASMGGAHAQWRLYQPTSAESGSAAPASSFSAAQWYVETYNRMDTIQSTRDILAAPALVFTHPSAACLLPGIVAPAAMTAATNESESESSRLLCTVIPHRILGAINSANLSLYDLSRAGCVDTALNQLMARHPPHRVDRGRSTEPESASGGTRLCALITEKLPALSNEKLKTRAVELVERAKSAVARSTIPPPPPFQRVQLAASAAGPNRVLSEAACLLPFPSTATRGRRNWAVVGCYSFGREEPIQLLIFDTARYVDVATYIPPQTGNTIESSNVDLLLWYEPGRIFIAHSNASTELAAYEVVQSESDAASVSIVLLAEWCGSSLFSMYDPIACVAGKWIVFQTNSPVLHLFELQQETTPATASAAAAAERSKRYRFRRVKAIADAHRRNVPCAAYTRGLHRAVCAVSDDAVVTCEAGGGLRFWCLNAPPAAPYADPDVREEAYAIATLVLQPQPYEAASDDERSAGAGVDIAAITISEF